MKNLIANKKTIIKISLLILFFILPFSNSDYSDNVTPQKITSDLAFYEINTCSISLVEFIVHNFNVAYQDHYKIRFNDYSSIRCFGTITGIDQIGHVFYISIGTNVFINLFIQTFFWLFLISFIERNRDYKISFKALLASVISSLLFCFGIYSESRFYATKLFEVDLSIFTTYFDIFIYLVFLNFLTLVVLDSRNKKIIQYVPFLFIFMGVYSGLNFYLFSLFFTSYGILKLFEIKKHLKLLNILNLLLLFWCFSSIGNNYFLDPDKVRGFTNTSFSTTSIIFWTYLIYFFIVGVIEFSSDKKDYFKFQDLNYKFLSTSVLIVSLGYLGSSNPIFNFYNYYYLGLSKYGTDNQSLFGVDKWGTLTAWRGMFPSAETIGEFFALSLLIYFINFMNYKKISNALILNIFPIVGLLASNNKAAIFLLLFCIYLKIDSLFKIKKLYKLLFISGLLFVLFLFVGLNSFGYSLDFTSNSFINTGNDYILDEQSSALEYLNSKEKSFLINLVLFAVGQLAFFINRSELWGIFIARYNPNYLEFLFGTSPFTLTKLYSEIRIPKYKYETNIEMGFLLPHSSFLLILTYIGLIGFLVFLIFAIRRINYHRVNNFDLYLINLLLFLSLIKSDSILYLPWVVIFITFMNMKHKLN